MSLRKRLILFTSSIAIISVLLISIINYAVTVTRLEKAVDDVSKMQASDVAMSTEMWLGLQRNTLDEMLNSILYNNNHDESHLHGLLQEGDANHPRNGQLEEDVSNDYEMMVDATKQYKEDGSHLNQIVAELSATSEELAATVNEIAYSIKEVSITVEESTMATTSIAEKNMNIVEVLNEIESIMEKNKEISQKLEDIVSEVKLS